MFKIILPKCLQLDRTYIHTQMSWLKNLVFLQNYIDKI